MGRLAQSTSAIGVANIPGFVAAHLSLMGVTAARFLKWSINPEWSEGQRRATSTRERKEARGTVYFIQDEDGFIKIGFTTNLDQRLSSLRTAARQRLTLLATEEATAQRERDLHRRFAAHRVRREWFRPDLELRSLIDSLQAA